MAQLPKSADVVIVGQGGIVGASIAHHLIEAGWENIVGIEKSAIPTDIGSTSHASDFCYMTAHDKLTCYTTQYSREFYEKFGFYTKVGGMEVARVDDDERMLELKRKVGSGKAFGTQVSMISAAEAKERFPLLEQSMIQGAMWDPDAGLVAPRSQRVAGYLVEQALASGKLEVFPNTPATALEVRDGRIQGVETAKGHIAAPIVIVACGIWGPLVTELAGVRLPIMPVEHPLLFFGPWDALTGTGKEIVHPLFRDQGNSSYVRDTGDPSTTEGGQVEWGYYKEQPDLVHPRDILEPGEARLSPSMRDLEMEQVLEGYERIVAMAPILGELGWNQRASFNGLLSVTVDGGSMIGETPEVRGLWLCEAIWVKDGPGAAKLMVDWLSKGSPERDPHGADIARLYPHQKSPEYTFARCQESASKIYNPAVHPREPYSQGRNIRRSPFWSREQELGGYFMEAGGWERAHGYQANETRLEKYLAQVPERSVEWDNRHFWRVSNAEHLAMSDDVGMINLSHFAIFDVSGPDTDAFLEYLAVARVGGKQPVGKGVYTHFLDARGGIRADLTIIRLDQKTYRVVCGGDTGHRDYVWMQRMRADHGYDVQFEDRSDQLACLGLWGPNARRTLQALAEDPDGLEPDHFPFATAREIHIRGLALWAFRISYVGEQGFELYFPFSYGLALWDLFYEQGAIPVGIETYANSRRLEKSLRLQNADLETEYNLYEAGLARAKVKAADFHGKAAYLEQRERTRQPAWLCTLTMLDNHDANGVARYPVGTCPLLDAERGEVLVDSVGRRSYTTSIAYGPSLGCNIALGYIPHEYAVEGRELQLEYLQEYYPVRIEAVGYRALYDPDNERMKS